MLRQGPLPALYHGAWEYLVGAAFVAAPFFLDYGSTPTALSIVVGVVLLVVTAASDLPTGLAKMIAVRGHVVFDLALGALLVASPFLFGFSDDRDPTAAFIVVGIVHLLLTIATRFAPERAQRDL